MHISEGVLDSKVIIGGYVVAAGLTALALKRVRRDDIPKIAVMGAEGAVNILYRKDIAGSKQGERTRKSKIKEYEELLYNPYIAANRGYIDAVIKPSETRKRLIEALELMKTKNETLPPKKHGNIPL